MKTETGVPRTKRRVWLWLISGSSILLVVTIILGSLILKWQVENRLSRAIAAADRDDPNWRIGDVMANRITIPDAENSALVVAAALKHLPENWPDAPWPGSGLPKPPPPPSMEVYTRLQDYPAGYLLRDDLAFDIRLALDDVADALRIARTLVEYPRGRHEITLGPTILDTPLAETQATRSIARLLQMDAVLRAHDGDLDGALDSCRAILNTGRSIGDEPFVISQLVRILIGGIALDTARRVLALGEPSDAAIARFQALVDDEAAQPLLTVGVRGERGGMDEMIRRMRTGQIQMSDLAGPTFNPSPPRTSVSPWMKSWLDQQRAIELEWMTDAVVIARKPLADQFEDWKRWDQRIDDTRKPWHGKLTSTLPLLLSPALSTGFKACIRYQTMLRSTSQMLAAERHRRKTGAWPMSVGQIHASLGGGSPIDPFDGQPIRIARHDGQIFVYGIGYNHQDDHGAYNPRLELRGGPVDIGTNAWDVSLRRRPAPLPEWPKNVFQTTFGESNEIP